VNQADSDPRCRHCGADRSRVMAPRGLCDSCYRQEAIRERYPILTTPGRRPAAEDLDFNGGYAWPEKPTRALPGTNRKLAELEARAAARQALFHPHDARTNLE
jgi:hypothetical protein